MPINKQYPPILPPKAGYVERVDSEGKHYYHPTEATLQAEALALERNAMAAQLKAAIESNSMLEECLVEMAGLVYA